MNEQKTMSILELYERFIQHPVVTIDSRNCPRDSIFFALKGERFDGNQFAQKALAAGCAFAVIDNADYYIDERTLLVEDVLKALQQLAHRHRKTIGLPIIGITGTNGKTTTKELIAAVLATKYKVLYTEGNLNNQIGVPLTLLRLNHEHEMAVIEMGASHPGDIQELVEIVHPDYGLITNVGCAHLEGFGRCASHQGRIVRLPPPYAWQDFHQTGKQSPSIHCQGIGADHLRIGRRCLRLG